jgi:hypothetical protein
LADELPRPGVSAPRLCLGVAFRIFRLLYAEPPGKRLAAVDKVQKQDEAVSPHLFGFGCIKNFRIPAREHAIGLIDSETNAWLDTEAT